MKSNNLFFSAFLGLAVILIFLNSCKKERAQEQCGFIPPQGTKFYIDNIELSPLRVNQEITENTTQLKNKLHYQLTKSDMQTMKVHMNETYNTSLPEWNQYIPESYVFFFNEGDVRNLDVKNVKAIGVTYVNNGVISYISFNNVMGSFKLVDEVKGSGSFLDFRDIDFLCDNVYKTTKWVAIDRLWDDSEYDKNKPPKRKSVLDSCLAKMRNTNTHYSLPIKGGGISPILNYCEGCGSSSDPNDHCGRDQGGGWSCQGTTCGLIAINNYGLNNNIDSTDLFDRSLAYSFRNDFMHNYEKGWQYQSFYYRISNIIDSVDYLDNTTLQDLIDVGYDFYQIAYYLQYGANNDIPLTTARSSRIENLIDNLETLSTGDDAMYSTIRTDLDLYTGQTRSYIIATLLPSIPE